MCHYTSKPNVQANPLEVREIMSTEPTTGEASVQHLIVQRIVKRSNLSHQHGAMDIDYST